MCSAVGGWRVAGANASVRVFVTRMRAMVDFDPDKDRRNRAKHGVPLALGGRVIADPWLMEWPDRSADYGETRWIGIGMVDGGVYVAVYTDRLDHVRMISVRRATRAEADIYYRSRDAGGDP